MTKITILDRFKKFSIGLPIFVALNMAIKFLVYIPIAKLCDFWVGILLMFLASFILRYLIILAYDHIQEDILLIEYFKEKQKQEQKITRHTYATRKILNSQKSGNKLLLLVGLVFFDPVITALYYREGTSKWNNIPDKKTFLLFTISVILCVIIMAMIIYGVFGLIDLLF